MSNDIRKAAEQALRPCPFCGGEPYSCRHLSYSNWGVTCQCGATGPTKNAGYRPLREAEIRAHNDAVAAWNERAALAAEQPQPEAPPVAYTSTAQLAALEAGHQRSITALCPRFAAMRDDLVPLYAAPPPAAPTEPFGYVWSELHVTPDSPNGPAEYHEELCFATDPPTSGKYTPVYAAPPAAATEPSDAVAEFARGIDAAARFVEKRLADYDAAHGSTDSDTGAREYPGTGDEYVCELDEIAEAIRGLAPPAAQSEQDVDDAMVERACIAYSEATYGQCTETRREAMIRSGAMHAALLAALGGQR